MKKVYLFAFITALLSCGTSQKLILDETSEIEFFRPFYKMIYPGQEDGIKTVVLVLPYQNQAEGYEADSVYFMGYHEALKAEKRSGQTVYLAKISLDDNHTTVIPPFDYKEKQALVSYLDAELKKHYYIIQNIVEEEPVFMP